MNYPTGTTSLTRKLLDLTGRPPGAYRSIQGSYDFGDFTLVVEQVPDDPGRHAALLHALVPLKTAKFPKDVFTPKSREIAARDFLLRRFVQVAQQRSMKKTGVRGGKISIDRPVNELLEHTAVVVDDECIVARFTAELPVKGRGVAGEDAVELMTKRVPAAVRESLVFSNVDGELLADWIETNEDADTLRDMLPRLGLAAFVADGSMLPRRIRADARGAKTFTAPDGLAVTVDLPNRGEIRGMGIPAGITLIEGGTASGKTTLLRAIELGVYNHPFGDGRELVVTVPDAVGIREEAGRKVECVDLSPVMKEIAPGIDPMRYTSKSAPPAVSFAANLMESLEIGTSLLIFDDETTTANFLGRDARMQALVPDDKEPLRPLVDILPVLRDGHGISSVIVGGTGDYLAIADTVIVLDEYQPRSATEDAKRIVESSPGRTGCADVPFRFPAARRPLTASLQAPKADTRLSSSLFGRGIVKYGGESIDLSKLTQIVSQSQARAIARAIALVHKLMDGSTSLADAVGKVMNRVEQIGLDSLSNRYIGDLSMFRAHELAAAVNRMKDLKIP